MLKAAIFLANFCPFLVHKLEKYKFLARIHTEYFQMDIFVIPRGIPNQKIWIPNQGIFFVFDRFFDTVKLFREITNYTVMISKLYCNDYYSTVLNFH